MALLCGVVVLSSCTGAQPDGGSPSRSPVTTPTVPVPPTPGDEFGELMWEYSGGTDPSDSPIDQMWREIFEPASVAYEAPSAIVPYEPGSLPRVACADELSPDAWRENARYCPADETIAYDAGFLRDFHEQVGTLAPVGVLAHEWGHHVQTLTSRGEFTIQDELQADCFAGMFMSAANLGGLSIEDTGDVMVAFYELGNERYENSRWFTSFEHGSPTQRAAAFGLGYYTIDRGYPFCQGYTGWQPGQVVEVGTFTFLELPGRPGTVEGTEYTLPKDDASFFPLPSLTLSYVAVPAESRGRTGETFEAVASARWARAREIAVWPVTSPIRGTFSYYYALEHDPNEYGYEEHGFAGIYPSEADPDHALLIIVAGEGLLPPGDEQPPDVVRRAEDAAHMGFMVMDRICAPHQSAEADATSFNEICAPNL